MNTAGGVGLGRRWRIRKRGPLLRTPAKRPGRWSWWPHPLKICLALQEIQEIAACPGDPVHGADRAIIGIGPHENPSHQRRKSLWRGRDILSDAGAER